MDTIKLHQLEDTYERAVDENEKISALIELALETRSFDLPKATLMAEEVIQRAIKINFTLGEGRGYNLLGFCLWLHGDYDEGLAVLNKAEKVALKIQDQSLLARIFINYGNIYRDLAQLSTALKYYENALVITEKLEDHLSQSVCLFSLANIHYDLYDYESALDYALKSLAIFRSFNDSVRLLQLNNTLGNIYFKMDDYEEALTYFKQNADQNEPDTLAYATAISGMGKVYYKMHNFKVQVLVSNANKELRSGMFATTSLLSSNSVTVLSVPRKALVGSTKNPAVYLIKNGKAALTYFTAGTSDGDYIEVINGLTKDDRIILKGQVNLTDGSPVKTLK